MFLSISPFLLFWPLTYFHVFLSCNSCDSVYGHVASKVSNKRREEERKSVKALAMSRHIFSLSRSFLHLCLTLSLLIAAAANVLCAVLLPPTVKGKEMRTATDKIVVRLKERRKMTGVLCAFSFVIPSPLFLCPFLFRFSLLPLLSAGYLDIMKIACDVCVEIE